MTIRLSCHKPGFGCKGSLRRRSRSTTHGTYGDESHGRAQAVLTLVVEPAHEDRNERSQVMLRLIRTCRRRKSSSSFGETSGMPMWLGANEDTDVEAEDGQYGTAKKATACSAAAPRAPKRPTRPDGRSGSHRTHRRSTLPRPTIVRGRPCATRSLSRSIKKKYQPSDRPATSSAGSRAWSLVRV